MRILPIDWTAVPKRPLPIVVDVPDDKSGNSCANCGYHVGSNTMLMGGLHTIALKGGFCRRHGWTYPSESDQQLYRCEDHDPESRVLDCLEDPPVRRCVRCHHVHKAHEAGRCRGNITTPAGQLSQCECTEFRPGQPTLAQVLAYCGMDHVTFMQWCFLQMPTTVQDLPLKALARYLDEFGPDYDQDTFIDWVLASIHNKPGWNLETWYEKRLAAVRADRQRAEAQRVEHE